MGGSKHKKIRRSVEPSPQGGVPSTRAVDDTRAKDTIEVEVCKQNMKVSAEAWKAFQAYQQYEDWSSETEKTDYTYSRLSAYHTKEVAPGIPVKPNLCRSPIKPSSPTSLYDYTSEQRENRRHARRATQNNSHTSTSTSSALRYRSTTSEDIADVPSRFAVAEETTYLHQLVQFWESVWVSLKNKTSAIGSGLGASVRYSASSFAAFFVAVWSYTAWSVHYLSSSIADRWSGLFTKNGQVYQDGRSSWIKDNTLVVWIKRSTTTVITIVTHYYRAATMSSAPSTKRYLWWLLLPLILLAGWQFLSEDTKENVISQLPSEKTFLHLWSEVAEWSHQLRESVLQFMSSIWGASLDLANQIAQYSSYWALYIWGLFIDGFGFIWDSIFICALQIEGIIQKLYASSTEGFFGIFAIISGLLSSNQTVERVDMPMPAGYEYQPYTYSTPTPSQKTEDGYQQTSNEDVSYIAAIQNSQKTETVNQKTSNEDLSYVAAIQDRLRILEDTLQAEKARRSADEERIGALLKSYRSKLQEHRLQSDASLKRCCRWPCPNRYLPPPTSTDFDVSSLIAELEVKLKAMEMQTTAEIDNIRREIVSTSGNQQPLSPGQFDAAMVRSIVDEAIKLYDADKTGRADYALQSAGGRIVSIRCTKAYSNTAPSWGWLPSLWSTSGGPEEAIRPGTSPGECWAFQGPVGQLALELSYPVTITGFTMEHISKHLSPSGTIDSAPQHFSVWGLKHADDLTEQYLFGNYIYEDNGETVQYFPVMHPADRTFKFVELKIVSNHGHPDYTCLYRIRVHGTVT